MQTETIAERIRCLEEQLEAVRVRGAILNIERKVLVERWARADGDEVLMLEEIGRLKADIVRVRLEIHDARP